MVNAIKVIAHYCPYSAPDVVLDQEEVMKKQEVRDDQHWTVGNEVGE